MVVERDTFGIKLLSEKRANINWRKQLDFPLYAIEWSIQVGQTKLVISENDPALFLIISFHSFALALFTSAPKVIERQLAIKVMLPAPRDPTLTDLDELLPWPSINDVPIQSRLIHKLFKPIVSNSHFQHTIHNYSFFKLPSSSIIPVTWAQFCVAGLQMSLWRTICKCW